MKKIDRQEYERFFFYGIVDQKDVIELILHFSTYEMHKKHSIGECYNIPNEQLENEIIQEALGAYRQFYRFVISNDDSNNATFELDEEVLKEQLRKEMHRLRDNGEVMYVKAGIYFHKYIDKAAYRYNKDWTEELYDILIQLEKLEKENSEEYYETWMLTRFARAVNRCEKEKALKFKKEYEALRERREEER